MKLENQVCTLEQAKRLKELGVAQDGIFSHVDNISKVGYEGIRLTKQTSSYRAKGQLIDSGVIKYFVAFTVAELGVMLPINIITARQKHTDTYACIALENGSSDVDYSKDIQHKETEAKARAAMLIYLLENGHTTAEEVNQRLLNA